jgi:hypothetical protein
MEKQMEPKSLSITFTDTPEEEVALIRKEFSLSSLATELEGAILDGTIMSEDAHIGLAELLTTFGEMFSLTLPELGPSTEDTLKLSSRDINLSRLLRERGLVRLYRLLKEKDEHGIPLFLGYVDPYSENPFQTQEDFVGWIAKDAHIPRSTLFMRFSTYEKMVGLGFPLEEAFQTIITKPYAMREVLVMAATWNRQGQIIDVNPEVVKNIARQVLPEKEAEEIENLADYYTENPSSVALQELVQAYKPALKAFVEELADHQNTKQMMDYVRHDVLAKPEITYSWLDEALIIHIVRKAIDESGMEVVIEVEDIPFIPDYPGKLDEVIIDDLLTRLPIKNRRAVFAERERQEQTKLVNTDDGIPFAKEGELPF